MKDYTTIAAIEANIPRQYLIEGLNDKKLDRTQPDPTRINLKIWREVLKGAQTQVNALLAPRYPTPFVNPIPDLVTLATTVFVCEVVYRRRDTPDDKNPWFNTAEDIRKQLKAIAADPDKDGLGIETPPATKTVAATTAPSKLGKPTRNLT